MKHRFVSAVADGGDSTLVRPQSNWNDTHIFGTASKSTSYGMTISDDVIFVTATATMTLPDPTTCAGQPFRIYNSISAGGTVTISPHASEVIYYSGNSSGASSATLVNFAQFMEFISDGTNWWVGASN